MLIGFFALWIILCGDLTVEIVVFDLIVTGAVFWFTCRFCRWSVQKERTFIRLVIPGIQYIALLIREILKANLAMLKVLLRPDMKTQVDPVLITVQVPLKTNIAKMTLANSITLTPGTITVENRGTEYVVHCINADFSRDVDCSAFVKALERIEAIAAQGKEETA